MNYIGTRTLDRRGEWASTLVCVEIRTTVDVKYTIGAHVRAPTQGILHMPYTVDHGLDPTSAVDTFGLVWAFREEVSVLCNALG